MTAKIVVAWSGGVSSAWCGGWALRTFPKDQVVFLWHDTKEEDEDTYRFSREMAAVLGHEITERSDGRSVTELFYDMNALANNRMAFCSRELKGKQRDKYLTELREQGIDDIFLVLGFTHDEWKRWQLAYAYAEKGGYEARFPLIENNITKQKAADWCKSLGACLPKMYLWSDHANCVGCVRGGQQYWLAVERNRPDIFQRRVEQEAEFGHTFINGISLQQLSYEGRDVKQRKGKIEIGSCECGD